MKMKKNKRLQPRTATIKALVGVLFILFFMNFTSSELLTFDNVKSYDAVKQEVLIKNTFGIGADIAKVKLNTPLENKVGIGYVKVAEMELTSYEDYKNLLSEMEFYNIKAGMSKIEVNFDYKYKTYEDYKVDDYEYVLSTTLKNGTAVYDRKLVGSHTEQREVWLPLEKLDYVKGEVLTIGIWTTTTEGQKVEWIPTIAGLKINEYASWTASLNTGLVSYYKFEGDYVDSVNASSPLTNSGTVNASGIIGSGISTTGGNYAYRTFGSIPVGTNALTVCLWDWQDGTTNNCAWGMGSFGSGNGFALCTDGGKYGITGFFVDVYSASSFTTGQWNLVCGVQESGNSRRLYVNGLNSANGTDAYNIGTAYAPRVGSFEQNPVSHDGKIDEVAIWNRALTADEMTQLYNEGAGMTYTTVFGALAPVLNSPANAYKTNNTNVTLNFTIGTSNLNITNYTLNIFYSNGTLFYSNTEYGNFGSSNITRTYNNALIPDASYIWGVKAGANNSAGEQFSAESENRTFQVHTTAPIINITSPTGNLGLGEIGKVLTLNYTATDPEIDDCWYDYNGTLVFVNCSTNTTTFLQESGKYNLTFYANDTFGNSESATTSWGYVLFQTEIDYDEQVYITSSDVISSNITYNSSIWSNIESYLVYNGTSYLTTKTGTGNNLKFSKTVDIPNLPGENVSFYFYYNLLNSTGTYTYNGTTYTQAVVSILIAPCDGVTTLALNFTLLEEGNSSLLNGSLEANFQYWISTGDGTSFINLTYANTTDEFSNYQFCITPATVNFTFDGTVSYYKTGYDRREYFFNDYLISNVSDNINLYLSQTALTDIFTLLVQDQNQDPVEGAVVYVERWDIGTNTFSTVGMVLTSSDGTGIINLRLNDAWYRYTVVYNGVVYLTTDPAKESTTSRTLDIVLQEENPWPEFAGVQYSLTHNNETNITLLTFADPTGAVNPGCLRILNITSTRTYTVFYSCVESTGGTISSFIDSPGSYIAQAIFYLDDGTYKVAEQLNFRIGVADRYEKMSGRGYFISMMLIGTAAMVGVAAGSIILGIVAIVGALFAVNLFGWLNLTGTVLYGLISILLLIAITASRKNP